MCTPLLADIIRQGEEEGILEASCAEDTAELIFQLAVALRESTAGLFLALETDPGQWPVIERKVACFETAIERVLKAPEGSVRLADQDAMAAFREQVGALGATDSGRGPAVTAGTGRGN